VGEEFRLPMTAVDNCNIADVLFISQIYNVLLELKLNSSTKVDVYSVCPTCVKPHVQATPAVGFFHLYPHAKFQPFIFIVHQI
jgi:hypothetical protein